MVLSQVAARPNLKNGYIFSSILRHLHPPASQPQKRGTASSSRSPNPRKRREDNEHDPLFVRIPTSALGLPLTPLQPTLTSNSKYTPLTRAQLHRLHRLSALNPPPEGSSEEKQLLDGLNELVGLMEVVKNLELPMGSGKVDMKELLLEGRGEVEITSTSSGTCGDDLGEEEGKRSRELLEWATRRKGDYYISRKSGPTPPTEPRRQRGGDVMEDEDAWTG